MHKSAAVNGHSVDTSITLSSAELSLQPPLFAVQCAINYAGMQWSRLFWTPPPSDPPVVSLLSALSSTVPKLDVKSQPQARHAWILLSLYLDASNTAVMAHGLASEQ